METGALTDDRSACVGVIAGGGRFPILVVEGAKRAGRRVVVVGVRGLADPALKPLADVFRWAGVVRPGRWIRILRRHGVSRAILAGSVRKSEMYGRFRLLRYLPDWTAVRIWFFQAADKRNDTILRALADHLESKGVELEECVKYNAENLAPEGVWTSTKPSARQLREVDFGWPIAKALGRLDVGQAVAVKEQDVIAVEAIEGTDRMIERASRLCPSGGWILIKVAKPDQDMRFDVPTVGPDTVENLKRHGARMLVVEAGKSFVVDRDQMIAAADRYGIVLLARRDTQP